jgi:hypothetical protein
MPAEALGGSMVGAVSRALLCPVYVRSNIFFGQKLFSAHFKFQVCAGHADFGCGSLRQHSGGTEDEGDYRVAQVVAPESG